MQSRWSSEIAGGKNLLEVYLQSLPRRRDEGIISGHTVRPEEQEAGPEPVGPAPHEVQAELARFKKTRRRSMATELHQRLEEQGKAGELAAPVGSICTTRPSGGCSRGVLTSG